jgi:uncharacterized protein with HEPN domain
MQDHIRQHLGDALRAVTLIGAFTDDAGFDDYVADDLLKSAVERQFQIIGRILATLASEDPATATALPHLDAFVELGEALTQHHDGTDDQHLWNMVENELPALGLILWHLLEPR